jgi:RNA polymerase sigma-70 factor (ECF subfamily)
MRSTSEAGSAVKEAGLLAELEPMHAKSFGWALSCCNHRREEAEEALQAAYLKIVEGTARFNGESSLRTWFFSVIRRTAAEQRRRRWMRGQIFDRWVAGQPALAPAPDAEALALQTEGSRTLLNAMGALSTRQREVLHLVFYQDLTIEEASRVLQVSLGTARTHFERGKRELRKTLASPGAQSGARA